MPMPCNRCGGQTCDGGAGCPANEWDDSCDEEDCPQCGGEGWIEDESDPLNDAAYDPETGATVYPLEPCPYCNPDGERIDAEDLIGADEPEAEEG